MGVFNTLKVTLFAVTVYSSEAWNREGFEAIGMTAMSALNAQATTRVKALMGGKDVVDISGWYVLCVSRLYLFF